MKAKQLRAKAREALKGRYLWALLASLITWIFGAISFTGTAGSGAFFGGAASGSGAVAQELPADTSVIDESIRNFINSIPEDLVDVLLGMLGLVIVFVAISLIVSLIIAIVGSAVRLGYMLFNIELYTGKRPSLDLLFSRMSIVFKAFWLQIVIGIKVLLWSLLFIIPGIIAAYRYSMAEYILAENPELKVKEAIRRSSKLMKGNKWKYFCLDLSFIGWDLLAGLLPGVGSILLNPYKQAAFAAFYIDKSGRFVVINDAPQTVSAEVPEEPAEITAAAE